MNTAIATLVILNLAMIGLLPIVFFRRDGQLNGAWLITAAPFFASTAFLLLGLGGFLQAQFAFNAWLTPIANLAAIVAAVASVTLIGLTVGVHRVPLALWHQQNDAPVEIVTWGPYAHVRHPFYSSFMLTLLAVFLVLPHFLTLATFAYALIALTVTARGEEQRLLVSRFGPQYRSYYSNTGRFLPRLGANR